MADNNDDSRGLQMAKSEVGSVESATNFGVPNHITLAGIPEQLARPILETAIRRGWKATRSANFTSLISHIRAMPPGGMVLINTSVLAGHTGIERITEMAELPALPRIYLTTVDLDVSALTAREICLAASIPVEEILVLPMECETLDILLGT